MSGKTEIAADFKLAEETKAVLVKEGYGAYIPAHLAYFLDYAESTGAKYKSWQAAFRNCVRADWGDIRKQMIRANGNRQVEQKHWWDDDREVMRKARELNVVQQGDTFYMTKARVFIAMGNGPWLSKVDRQVASYIEQFCMQPHRQDRSSVLDLANLSVKRA